MTYSARVICDSVSLDGVRLTTIEATYPRIVHAEMMTHRVFSRNSASSRAIPIEKMLKKVKEDPFIPIHWGKNQKGMQAEQELSLLEQERSQCEWLSARDNAVMSVEWLLDIGVHKQITNRLLEPWLWHTTLITSTEWENFWGLRCNKDAQPEIRRIADMMREAYSGSTPRTQDEWHLPLVYNVDMDDLVEAWHAGKLCSGQPLWQVLCKVSAGRCARVSYLTHDGKRDPMADVELCDRLISSGHMSPLEHVAVPMCRQKSEYRPTDVFVSQSPVSTFCANFRGWVQLRKVIPNEACFTPRVDT